MRRLLSFCLFTMLLVLAPRATFAQVLADRMPKDAVIYVGWRGTAQLGPAYDQSNLKGLLEATKLREQIANAVSQAIEKDGGADPKAKEKLAFMKSLSDSALLNPTALYFGGMDFSNPDKPLPKIALVIQTGPGGSELAAQLAAHFETRPNKDVPVVAKMVGDFLFIGIGKVDNVEQQLAGTGEALSTDAEFKKTLQQATPDSALTLYLNNEALMQVIEDAIAISPDQGMREMLPKVLDALNIGGFKRTIATGTFDGKDWSSRLFIAMDQQRTGIPGMLQFPAMSDEAMKAIPKTALWARSLRIDFTRLLADVRDIAGKLNPRAPQQIDLMLQRGTMALGVDVEKDLFPALGTEWILYGSGDAAVDPIQNITVLIPLKNPEAATKAFESIQDFANGLLAMQFGAEKTFTRADVNGLPMHTLKMPRISLAWAIKDKYFAFSTSNAAVESALTATTATDGGLLANEQFQALNKKLGNEKFSFFGYTDVTKTAGPALDMLKKIMEPAIANAAAEGITLPTIPSVETIAPFLSPQLYVAWTDDAGFHMKGQEPFPLSMMLDGQNAAVQAMLLPAMARGRMQAQNVAGMASLRQIGLSCLIYSNDHNGDLPPDLGTLVTAGMTDNIQIFVAPGKRVPAAILKGTKEEQAKWVNENSSYVYLGAGKSAKAGDAATTPLAHERMDGVVKAMTSVLFMDGHVESVQTARAEEMFGPK